jgi:hypothetical protein
VRPVDSVEFDGHTDRPVSNGPNQPYGNVKQPAEDKAVQKQRAAQEQQSVQDSYRADPKGPSEAHIPLPNPSAKAAPAKKPLNPWLGVLGFVNDNTINLHKNPNCGSLTASCNPLQFGDGGTADAAASFSLFVPGGEGLRFEALTTSGRRRRA